MGECQEPLHREGARVCQLHPAGRAQAFAYAVAVEARRQHRQERRAGPDAVDTEFVCIVRPIARATTPDGGPLRYRVSHRASMWRPGTPPKLEQLVIERDAKLSV